MRKPARIWVCDIGMPPSAWPPQVTFRWEVVPSQASGGVLDGPMLTLLPEGLQTGLTALRCTVTNAGTGASATLRVSILGARAPWCSLGDALDACLHISPTEVRRRTAPSTSPPTPIPPRGFQWLTTINQFRAGRDRKTVLASARRGRRLPLLQKSGGN